MQGERAYRLLPWAIRAMVPPEVMGTYALRNRHEVVYVGRSRDLRRRLLEHARAERAPYFTFDVHSPVQAYWAESAIFHVLKERVANALHPAAPAKSGATCPFCSSSIIAAQKLRLAISVRVKSRPRSPPLHQ